jgi:hypothetical protein
VFASKINLLTARAPLKLELAATLFESAAIVFENVKLIK